MEENTTTPSPDQTGQEEKEVVKCIMVPEEKLEALLDRIKDYERKEDEIAECVLQILKILGLADEKGIKPEYSRDDFSLGDVMKKLFEMISITDMTFRPKKFEKDMIEKFSFIKKLLYIFKDYVERKQNEQRQQRG